MLHRREADQRLPIDSHLDAPQVAEESQHNAPGAARASTEEAVRTAAFFRWEAAGCPLGDGVEFWLAAEGELKARETLQTDAASPEDKVQEASEESFPASDPPAWIRASTGGGRHRQKAAQSARR